MHKSRCVFAFEICETKLYYTICFRALILTVEAFPLLQKTFLSQDDAVPP